MKSENFSDGHIHRIAPRAENSNNTTPSLDEVSPKDKSWRKHRFESDQIADNFRNSDFGRYAERIDACSQLLDFRLVPDRLEGAYKLKLASTHLCHCRQCQICSWRRSLMYKARAYKALPNVVKDYPSARYLFMTLTLKNCAVYELRTTIKQLNQAFARLTKRKVWPGVGYLKTVEVTRGCDRVSAHPHLHILVMVEPSFFGRNYIRKAEWCQLWKKCLRVDYVPIMDVKAIKVTSSPVGLLSELVKYQTKPNDLIFSDKAWFLEYVKQVHGTKAFALGGVFRQYFKELDNAETHEEMIGNDRENELDEGHLYFGWRRAEKRYRIVDN